MKTAKSASLVVLKAIRPDPPDREGRTFTTDSTDEGQSFDAAQAKLRGGEHARFRRLASDVSLSLGLRARHHSAIGDTAQWGSEPSLVTEIDEAPDWETVRTAAAHKGYHGHQKAVLPFLEDPAGKDHLYVFDVPHARAKLPELRQTLDQHGVAYRTFVPHAAGTRVMVYHHHEYDPDNTTEQNLLKVGAHYGQDITRHTGRGEFLGGETRAAGRKAYRQVLDAFAERAYHGRAARPAGVYLERRAAPAAVGAKSLSRDRAIFAKSRAHAEHVTTDPAGSIGGGKYTRHVYNLMVSPQGQAIHAGTMEVYTHPSGEARIGAFQWFRPQGEGVLATRTALRSAFKDLQARGVTISSVAGTRVSGARDRAATRTQDRSKRQVERPLVLKSERPEHFGFIAPDGAEHLVERRVWAGRRQSGSSHDALAESLGLGDEERAITGGHIRVIDGGRSVSLELVDRPQTRDAAIRYLTARRPEEVYIDLRHGRRPGYKASGSYPRYGQAIQFLRGASSAAKSIRGIISPEGAIHVGDDERTPGLIHAHLFKQHRRGGSGPWMDEGWVRFIHTKGPGGDLGLSFKPSHPKARAQAERLIRERGHDRRIYLDLVTDAYEVNTQEFDTAKDALTALAGTAPKPRARRTRPTWAPMAASLAGDDLVKALHVKGFIHESGRKLAWRTDGFDGSPIHRDMLEQIGIVDLHEAGRQGWASWGVDIDSGNGVLYLRTPNPRYGGQVSDALGAHLAGLIEEWKPRISHVEVDHRYGNPVVHGDPEHVLKVTGWTPRPKASAPETSAPAAAPKRVTSKRRRAAAGAAPKRRRAVSQPMAASRAGIYTAREHPTAVLGIYTWKSHRSFPADGDFAAWSEHIASKLPVESTLHSGVSFITHDGRAVGRRAGSITHLSLASELSPEDRDGREWSPGLEDEVVGKFMRRSGAIRLNYDYEVCVGCSHPLSVAQARRVLHEARVTQTPLVVDVHHPVSGRGERGRHTTSRTFPRPTLDEVNAFIAEALQAGESKLHKARQRGKHTFTHEVTDAYSGQINGTIVAHEAGTPRGYLQYSRLGVQPPQVDMVEVAPAHRGRGVGRALVRRLRREFNQRPTFSGTTPSGERLRQAVRSPFTGNVWLQGTRRHGKDEAYARPAGYAQVWAKSRGADDLPPPIEPKLHEAALREFGETQDEREAGYLLPDGRLLDFSGKREGGQAGMRNYDHRDISRLMSEDDDSPFNSGTLSRSGTEGMVEFMTRAGAARIHVADDSVSVDAVHPLTPVQAQTVTRWARARGRRGQSPVLTVDHTHPEGHTLNSEQFDRPTVAAVQRVFTRTDGRLGGGYAFGRSARLVLKARTPRVVSRDTDVVLESPEETAWAGAGQRRWRWTRGADYLRSPYGDPPRGEWGKPSGHLLTGRRLDRGELPATLYHVTAAKRALQQSGHLLARRGDQGLGGGQADGVSFTTSRDSAALMQRELTRAVRIARGEHTHEHLEQYAREDEHEGGLPVGYLQSAVDAGRTTWATNVTHSAYATPESRRSLVYDAFRSYLRRRDSTLAPVGGSVHPSHARLKDPLLFGRLEHLARVDPEDVGIVEVPSAHIPPRALVTSGSDDFLHEVRAYSDVPLTARAAKSLRAAQHTVEALRRAAQQERRAMLSTSSAASGARSGVAGIKLVG